MKYTYISFQIIDSRGSRGLVILTIKFQCHGFLTFSVDLLYDGNDFATYESADFQTIVAPILRRAKIALTAFYDHKKN